MEGFEVWATGGGCESFGRWNDSQSITLQFSEFSFLPDSVDSEVVWMTANDDVPFIVQGGGCTAAEFLSVQESIMALAEAYVEAGIDSQDMTLAEALTWADEHGFLIEHDRAAAAKIWAKAKGA